MSKRFLFLLSAAILAGCVSHPLTETTRPRPPAVKITVVGPEVAIYRSAERACGSDHVFGRSIRAFRDSKNKVHLFSTALDWEMIGDSVDSVKPDCSRPSSLKKFGLQLSFNGTQDYPWVESLYSIDGESVHLIAGAGRKKSPTDVETPMGCPYYAITQAVSRDKGRNFGYESSDPTIFEWQVNKPLQLRRCDNAALDTRLGTTNVVKKDSFYYAIIHVDRPDKSTGNCLIRTANLDDPKSWRGWDGKEFSAPLFKEGKSGGAESECQLFAIGGETERPARSLTWHPKSKTFIAMIRNAFHTPDGKAADHAGFYYATSPDLIHWSDVALLRDLPPVIACKTTIFYPSLIDPSSSTRNFEEIGDTGFVFGLKAEFENCILKPERDVVRMPVRIDTVEQN